MVKSMCKAFLEYTRLEIQRREKGLSGFAYRRWYSLKKSLDQKLVQSFDAHEDSPTVFDACFKTPWHFQRAYMSNISGGGLFVDTEYPADIGTKVKLRIRVEEPKTEIELTGEVVSQNVANEYSTAYLGMGICFRTIEESVRKQLTMLLVEARQEKKRALEQVAQTTKFAAMPSRG